MSQNQRQSNIELLRCFAMLCIIVYHLCLFALGGVPTSTKLYQALQIPLHIGVPLFVLISGYFGIRFSLKGFMLQRILLLRSVCSHTNARLYYGRSERCFEKHFHFWF